MHQRRRRLPVAAMAIAIIATANWAVSPVRASATIVVDVLGASLGGAGCSLPEAILAANEDASTIEFDPGPPHARVTFDTGCAAGSGHDVIVLSPGLYAYAVPMTDVESHLGPAALPMIDSAITIEGAGAVLQRNATATSNFRLFSVGPGGDLDLREVTVGGFTAQGGDGADGGGGGMGAGGAIFVDDGALRVQWSTFVGNVASGGAGDSIFSPGGGGGGGGGIGGGGGFGSLGGGGGGGARGSGAAGLDRSGGAGGGTLLDGGPGTSSPFAGGYLCGAGGNDILAGGTADGFDADCPGGGGGGGTDGIILTGDGGSGAFGGGGGGGANDTGNGGNGGFGGGGGAAGTSAADDGGGGGDAGFGGGGGAGPGGTIFGGPGSGGTFGGNAGDLAGGGGAGLGGAIFGYRANIIVSNSTFTENAAVRGVAGGAGASNGSDAGGAIFAVGGATTIVNTTIAGNESTGDGAGLAVYKPTTGESASLNLTNTIVAGNTGRDECFVLNGVAVSGARNLIATHSTDRRTPCPAVYLTDDPELGPLALNAPGRTPTMALSATSPAIDEALDVAAPLDDQRGVARPQGAYPDIGAYERDGAPPPPPDLTAPTAAPVASPSANGNGWNRSSVTVTWNWSDGAGGSGLDPTRCPSSSGSSGEGVDLVISATCYDLAGNAGSASVLVDVDATAPTAAPTSAPSPNAAGWNRTDVTVSWHWTDATGGSGLDATRCPSTSTSVGEGVDVVIAATCYDRADNAGSGSVTVDVDKTAPGVTCGTTPAYTLGGDHSANVIATVSDGLSGPAAATVSADVTATDVAVVGPGSKSLTGHDVAGSQTTVSCPYLVKYAFLGFQQPLPPAWVKAGSMLPVKFQLGDASGATLPDADAAGMASACLVEVTLDGIVQGCATYDPLSNTFQRDIKTPKNLPVGPHAVGIRVRVVGGAVVNTDQVTVQVRK
jgi:hypothetical protein